VSRPLAKRIEQLRALKRFFVENEAAIVEALKADLGRPTFEALFYDNLLPLHEIEVFIFSISGACKTTVRGTRGLPGTQSLRPLLSSPFLSSYAFSTIYISLHLYIS
jgi:hypothetical protein